MTTENSFWRDANRIPILGHGLTVSKEVTFTGSAETVATPIFTITGVVELLKIWGVCTTGFGANHTDAHLRINDQTATDVVLSKTTTLDLSGISAGAAIVKNGLAAAVLSYRSADAATSLEPAVADEKSFTPAIITQKTGSIQTDIEYVYTTTDEPTSGAMQFFVGYLPLSEGAKIEAS
jgi:hypothetical protein